MSIADLKQVLCLLVLTVEVVATQAEERGLAPGEERRGRQTRDDDQDRAEDRQRHVSRRDDRARNERADE